MAVRTKASEVEAVANELIELYHPHLKGFRVDYAFLDNTPTRGGREIWGSARRATGLTAYLAGQEADEDEGTGNESFFVIEISGPIWKDLDADQRRALVDHQLCHCGTDNDEDGNAKPIMLAHDLEEFVSIFKRHGNWSEGIKAFAQAGLQPALPFHADAASEESIESEVSTDPNEPTSAELAAAGVNTLPDPETPKRSHKKQIVETDAANGADAPNGAKSEHLGTRKDPHVPDATGFGTLEERRQRNATKEAQAAATLAN